MAQQSDDISAKAFPDNIMAHPGDYLCSCAEAGYAEGVKDLFAKADAVGRTAAVRDALRAARHDGGTPLTLAAEYADAAMIRLLIGYGADIEARDRDGFSPLEIAARREVHDDEIIEMCGALIDAGADVNAASKHNARPLLAAVRKNDVKLTGYFLKKGALPDFVSRFEGNPLTEAAVREGEITRMLLDAGADPDLADYERLTPLFRAVEWPREGNAALLLERGADPDKTSGTGSGRPLHVAARRGSVRMLKLLAAAGADIEALDGGRASVLYAACEQKKTDCARVLIESGADPNRRDGAGRLPLLISVALKDAKTAKLLCGAGADPNIKNSSGVDALTVAAVHLSVSCVKVLIDAGAAINPPDGKTRGVFEAVRSLTPYADSKIKNRERILQILTDALVRQGRAAAESDAPDADFEI